MATLAPELEEILDTLEATSFRGAAQMARQAIGALPIPEMDSADSRLVDVHHQFGEVFQTLLAPLKIELEASRALTDLAHRLGVPDVKVILEGDASTLVNLTSDSRIGALAAMVEELGFELAAAEQRAQVRTAGQ